MYSDGHKYYGSSPILAGLKSLFPRPHSDWREWQRRNTKVVAQLRLHKAATQKFLLRVPLPGPPQIPGRGV